MICTKKAVSLLMPLFLVCASAAMAAPVSIQNAGFEQPNVNGQWTSVSSLSGWNIDYGAITINPYNKDEGVQGLYMAGAGGARISQDLIGIAAANTTYTLTVDVQDNNMDNNFVGLSVMNLTDTVDVWYHMAQTVDMNWTTYTLSFVSPTTWTANGDLRIFIEEGAGKDLMIDNVHFDATPVPEPSSLLALLAGAIGFVGLRRRKI